MAHILESIRDKESSFTATDVLSEELTHLAVRMADYATMLPDENAAKAVIEDWRNNVFMMRNAVRRLGGEGV